MKALGRLPAGHGIAAMQPINVVVLNLLPWHFPRNAYIVRLR